MVMIKPAGKVKLPAPKVPAVTREAGTAPAMSVPMVVREEVITVLLRVFPVRVPAGAVPEMLPVKFPVKLPVPLVKKRLVVEAVPVKKLVEVLLVVVEFRPVKFCNVDEPRESKLPKVPRPELLWVVENKVVAKRLVVVA